jgi:protein phosphatase
MTHVGKVRSANEDSILTDPTGVFWAIADGMGGHGHGDIASEIVIDHLSELPDEGEPKGQIDALLKTANQAIQQRAATLGSSQMGSTAVVLKLEKAVGHFAWVGDCRGYLCREGSLRQLTRDHTIVEELVHDGLLAPENAKDHASANVVTRAVGAEPVVEVDHLSVPLIAGDRIVLCSDGLNVCVDDPTIYGLLQQADDPDTASRYLIAAALENGAPDNVSVIVVFVKER